LDVTVAIVGGGHNSLSNELQVKIGARFVQRGPDEVRFHTAGCRNTLA
jgi:hypothetical protein